MASNEKPKEDRLREGIELLRKLTDVGVPSVDPGYQTIQRLVSDWVKNGETVQTTVVLSRLDRVAEILLPRRRQNTASILLRQQK